MCTCVNLNNGLCTFMLLLIVSKYGTGREVIFRAFGKPLRNPVPPPCLCGMKVWLFDSEQSSTVCCPESLNVSRRGFWESVFTLG